MKCLVPCMLGAVALTAASANAALVASWAFPTTVAPTATNFQINFPIAATTQLNAGTANITTDGAVWNGAPAATGNDQGLFQYFTGTTVNAGADPAGSGLSMRSLSGLANGKSLTFRFDNTGYQDTILTLAERVTTTGPTDVAVSLSTDGVLWTPALSYTLTDRTGTFYLRTVDLSAFSVIDNASSAFVRLTYTGFSATSSTGAVRLDNVKFDGTLVPTPGSVALMGLAGLVVARRRR
jgi:hypothetical protein